MKKAECRVGMVVCDRGLGTKAVVAKCNPKNARLRFVEGERAGEEWNIPYSFLSPVFSDSLHTEMTMRSFEDPDNPAFKIYFSKRSVYLPEFPEGSPEFHIMNAICELWRKLSDENLEIECREEMEKEALKPGSKRRPATIMRDILAHYSSMINNLFSAIGCEVSLSEAESWEKHRKEKIGTV